jgi:YVTN family beta-propeller protein
MKRIILLSLAMVAAGSIATVSARAAGGTLIVLNKSDHEAALVHPDTFTVLARIPTGKGPHEAAVSPDGRTAYVTNYGSFAIFKEGERPRMEPGRSITVIDLPSRTVKDTFDLGDFRQPHGIAVSRNGRLLWVTVEGSQAVLELDAASGKVLRSWITAQNVSHMVEPTPDEKKLYVANIGSGSVTVINRATDEVKSIPTGAGAEGIAATGDGKQVWVTNRGSNTISVLDTVADQVVVSFESGGTMPIRVKFTVDGRQAWVSNARSNTVTVFDAATRAQVGKIEVGAVPVGIQMTPDGKRAFVANTNDNKVTVMDVASRRVLSSFVPGTEPDGMAWAK